MTNVIKLLLISALLVISANAFLNPWGPKNLKTPNSDEDIGLDSILEPDTKWNYNYTQIQGWFDGQRVDHSDINSEKIWRQRYWSISNFYDHDANGPVFVIICGEFTCPGLENDRLFPLQLAQEFGAMILVLEHRFYGLSQPFGDKNLTVNRLRYLTVDQSLADLAFFMNWVRHNGSFNVNEETKFITIGGSYPGALSAWFREKYPYLTVGALASSAVVDSFIDFSKFDEQVYNSLMRSGEQCVFSVQNVNKYVEEQLKPSKNNSMNIKMMMNASKLTDDEFLFFWADSIALLVQYGHRSELCNLLASYQTVEIQFNALKQFIALIGESNPVDYGSYYLSQEIFDGENDGSRQWAWQICSELGWFNTAPTRNISRSMRSSRVNITFYRNWCEDVFDEEVWPERGLANLYRGGRKLQATNLIMTNGAEDPWQWASIKDSEYSGITTYYIDCEDCAHCVDLYTPTENDSWTLWWTRQKIRYSFSRWLSSWWPGSSTSSSVEE